MTRPPDETIPREEPIYRGFSERQAPHGKLDPHAPNVLDFDANQAPPACLFARGKYLGDEPTAVAAILMTNSGFRHVGHMRAGDLPEPIERPDTPSIEFECVDDPLPGNEPHREVRLFRSGADRPDAKKFLKGGKALRKLRKRVREKLAEKITLVPLR